MSVRAIRSFPIRTALPMRASNSSSARGSSRAISATTRTLSTAGHQRPWTIRARDESSALSALDHDAEGEAASGQGQPLAASPSAS